MIEIKMACAIIFQLNVYSLNDFLFWKLELSMKTIEHCSFQNWIVEHIICFFVTQPSSPWAPLICLQISRLCCYCTSLIQIMQIFHTS